VLREHNGDEREVEGERSRIVPGSPAEHDQQGERDDPGRETSLSRGEDRELVRRLVLVADVRRRVRVLDLLRFD